jgi:hypothetical protein
MMPQLGVLAEVHPKAATEVFNKDCLIHLGTCIAPAGEVKGGKGGPVMNYTIEFPDGKAEKGTLDFGTMKLFKLGMDEKTSLPLEAKAVFEPTRNFDLGAGKGNKLERRISGGVVGIILDGRGRPFAVPTDDKQRVAKLREWMLELDIYPRGALDRA